MRMFRLSSRSQTGLGRLSIRMRKSSTSRRQARASSVARSIKSVSRVISRNQRQLLFISESAELIRTPETTNVLPERAALPAGVLTMVSKLFPSLSRAVNMPFSFSASARSNAAATSANVLFSPADRFSMVARRREQY